jgi:hypothetical protein
MCPPDLTYQQDHNNKVDRFTAVTPPRLSRFIDGSKARLVTGYYKSDQFSNISMILNEQASLAAAPPRQHGTERLAFRRSPCANH